MNTQPRSSLPDLQVSDDLAQLVRAIPSALVEMCPLRRPDAPRSTKSAFRLRFADGSLRKARICGSTLRAARVDALVGLLAPRVPVARVLARHRTALLTEWIDGQPLDQVTLDLQVLRDCAAVHARIHTAVVPADYPWPVEDAVQRWRRFTSQLQALVDDGVLSAADAGRARAAAEPHTPAGFASGLAHRDFCPENIVVDAAGSVSVVDNETIAIDALDFDLARTWYRWPMGRAQREAYLTAYASHRSPADFLAHFPYWAILVLVDSAYLRLPAAPPVRAVPVRRLHALLAADDLQSRPGRLAVES